MITVLHVIDTGGPGGAETVFLNTATGLDRTRFRSIAVVGSDGWLAARLRERGVDPYPIPAKGSFNLAYLRALMRTIKERRVDVIAAHLYGSAIYASLAGLLCRVPVVSVLHGQSDVNPNARLASVKAAIVRRGSSRIVFVSRNLKEDLTTALRPPEEKCEVVPNGVDLSVFQPGPDQSLRTQLELPPDALLVGAIGNIRKPKAYDVFLRAARLAADRSPRLHFVIAGEGSGTLQERLLILRQELGLERKVSFLGLRPDVATILKNLDVFALSSRTEGFSIACIEAMACGIPVVATRSGGPQQILDESCGILVPTDDPAALAEGICRLALEPRLAAALSQAALSRVRERFSLGTMIGSYERIFASLHARRVVKCDS
jgi:glycosyltransferase involved in cell wall biosynthesis